VSILDWIVTSYCVLFCLAWCVSFLVVLLFRRIRIFEKADPPLPRELPRLSVVIATCNDADTIEKAVNTLLQQDYPDLEVVVVNDRSTDGTGRIIERIARENSRVRMVHIQDLPSGWLGKVHALRVGTQKTSGEWILYTDADVYFKQGALRKAIAFVLADHSDHLALMPVPRAPSFWLRVVLQAVGGVFVLGTRAAHLGKPSTKAFVGAGAFNLVRKAAFDRTEGFAWLRMEVVDDVGLGLMLQRSGARSSFAITLQDVSFTWYPSLRAMFKGLEKNFFGVLAFYSIARMIGIVVLAWAYALAPLVAILYSLKIPFLLTVGLVAYLFLVAGAVGVKIMFKQKLLPLLLVQVGHILISLMLLRSGIMCIVRGGITWRGTWYPIDELRAGHKVKV
jgi:cellulose synthase/poly-beta-1,6-N-acetylglucosamine synthase-like glycosyltransferase